MICDNINIADNTLYFAGHSVNELAAEYGTPLYLLDENKIREKCRIYKSGFEKNFREGSMPLYASKASSFKHIYRIAEEEGMGVDVVSPGEIYTAWVSGFDMTKAFYHSCAKSDADISFAMDKEIGYFVADCAEEVLAIEAEAAKRSIEQNILLRITPGIDPHTYAEVATGLVDSKFGSAIETNQAFEITELTLKCEHVKLKGFHCHVGSMVFAEDVYDRTADVMIAFMADVKAKYGYTAEIFDIGGGFGVRYVESDPTLDIAAKIDETSTAIKAACVKYSFPEPLIMMEPGRSIVADAGMTLYTAQAVKKLPGYKNYVSVDGGITDNPRYALYGSQYTCYNASRLGESNDTVFEISGRCCESGDIIQPAVSMPGATARGDIIAVCTTGAYNYSMASNYNRVARPALVMVTDSGSYVAVRRESLDDIIQNDI